MQGVRAFRFMTRNAINMVARRNYGHGRKHKVSTMNDLPVPEGDFFALHAQRQRKYNAILATGVIMSGIGVYILSTGEIINFNWSPPDTYE